MPLDGRECLYSCINRDGGGLVIGFIGNIGGKIETIYSDSPRFTSEYTGTDDYDLIRSKKVSLQIPDILELGKYSLQVSENWKHFPPELKDFFESGKIFVTSGNDLYGNISEDTQSSITGVRQSIKEIIPNTQKYFLLHYGTPNAKSGGRGSILVEVDKSGNVLPVKVTIDNTEYVIELKGSGETGGGFGGSHKRQDGNISIYGGATRNQGKKEFVNLESIGSDTNYKIGGVIYFEGEGDFQQSYIIRLSPTTVRSSFCGNEAFLDMSSNRIVGNIVKGYVKSFLDLSLGKYPRFMDIDSWHAENLAVSGKGIEFTDFSDYMSFGSDDFPFLNETFLNDFYPYGFFVCFKSYIHTFLDHVTKLKGYNSETHDTLFIEEFLYQLGNREIFLSRNNFEKPNDILADFAVQVLGHRVWCQRIQSGYSPTAFIDYIHISESQIESIYDALLEGERSKELKRVHYLFSRFIEQESIIMCSVGANIGKLNQEEIDLYNKGKQTLGDVTEIYNTALLGDTMSFISFFSDRKLLEEKLNFYK